VIEPRAQRHLVLAPVLPISLTVSVLRGSKMSVLRE
jgi:hypothetical protein